MLKPSELTQAIFSGDIAQVRAALDNGANPNEKGSMLYPAPLELALERNRLDIFILLLESGANPNITTADNTTLLIQTIFQRRIDFTKALLDNNVDVDQPGTNNETALWVAYQYRRKISFPIMVEIIKKTKKINQVHGVKNNTLLSEAVERGDNEMLEHLLQLNDVDADVLDSDGKHALTKAVEKKNYSIAIQLAERTKNLNAKVTGHDSMLKCAIVDKEFDFAVKLVELGADVNVADHEDSILHCALNNYPVPEKLIYALIAHGAKCDVPSRKTGNTTPLHIALRMGHIELVKAFLVKKVDPSCPDSSGATPLYTACRKDNLKLVELLLEYGANPLITLHMAGTLDNKTIKALQAVTITAAMQAEAKQYDIATAYRQSIVNMSKMIILGQETVKVQVKPHSDMQVISNNEGYGPTVTMDHVTHGKKLTVEVDGKEYPVGYNIYIPEGIDRVNKVLVQAYGGWTIEDDRTELPARSLRSIDSLLLSAGCVVIKLNLPDLLQRKDQRQMDADLQKQVHAAIHKFYQTISQDPSSLHENLDKLGFKLGVYTLYGASFGGRTAVRHGQLYPGTFKFYIAHDGVFADLVDMPIIVNDRKYAHSEVLLPIHHVESTLDPILFFQNRDDNNVNIKSVLKFYDALLKAGKGDLARLCFFEKGGPIPSEQEIFDKGHFPPDMELSRYVDAILTFMDSGPSQIPELHQHFHLREKQLANQFFRLANGNYNVKKRFLALAIQRFKDNTREQDSFFKQKGISWDEHWAQHYRPILKVLGEIRYLVNDAAAFMTFKESLISQDLLNDVIIEKAVRSHAAAFREYYKETHDFEEISIDDICNNPFIIRTFRDQLTRLSTGDSKDLIMFLLESLLFANPELLSSIHHSQAWTQESFEDQERNYKKIFEASARESKASMQRAWQAVIRNVIDKQKTVVEAFDLKNIDDHAEVYKGMFLRDTFFVRSQEDSAAENLIGRLIEKNQALIKSIEESSQAFGIDTEVVTLAKHYLKDDQAKLSEKSLEDLAALLDKREEIQSAALQLLVNILIIDKAIDPLHKGNTIKAIKRQAMLSQFIQHSEIQYKAEKSWHAEFKHVYPDLNTASILRLNSIIKRGMQTADYNWQNPLIDVIKKGDIALAKVLTELVPDSQVRLIDSTALELACEKDDLDLIIMLSERGVSVTDKCLANAQNSSPEIIAYLIKKGAKLLQEDEHRLGDNSILENPVFARLVNRALIEDNEKLTNIVEALAKKYNCKAQFTSMTGSATKLNQNQLTEDDVVKLVQLNQLDVNFIFASGHTLLMYAIENNYINLVRVLIEKRVQLDIKDQKGFRAIHHAFYKQKIDCAKIILEGHTTEGITDNDRKFGESLLSSGSNYKFNFQKTKFQSGKLEIKASQANFEKLFRVAIEQGNLEQAIDLLRCVLNVYTKQNSDILSSAIKADATQFAICLLKAGVNANSLDMNGDACLFLAINRSNITLVKALIEHGANVNAKNRDGKTCLDIAEDMGNRDIVEHIKQKSAKPLCPSYLMYGRDREQTSATTKKEQEENGPTSRLR